MERRNVIAVCGAAAVGTGGTALVNALNPAMASHQQLLLVVGTALVTGGCAALAVLLFTAKSSASVRIDDPLRPASSEEGFRIDPDVLTLIAIGAGVPIGSMIFLLIVKALIRVIGMI